MVVTPSVILKGIGFLVAHTFGAGVGIAFVAIDAMIDFGQDLAFIHSRVGQFKTIPAAAIFLVAHPGSEFAEVYGFVFNEIFEIPLFGKLETQPIGHHIIVLLGDKAPALHDVHDSSNKFGGLWQHDHH